MTNLLTFHVPNVRSKASIDFKLDARPFLSTQFQPLVPAETLPAPNSVEMWAAAHDCGYGVSWDKRVECSGKEWQALHRHLYQRLRFHLTLLENASPLAHLPPGSALRSPRCWKPRKDRHFPTPWVRSTAASPPDAGVPEAMPATPDTCGDSGITR
ncbi:hypothetical protein [Stenotrophomonas nematodicola]|uniref:DUF2442 domain-containing protein n=1 Tax=Stenotrophomonas nematodicola TaxID=2656746 RepID=A0ABW7CV72_9GAMM